MFARSSSNGNSSGGSSRAAPEPKSRINCFSASKEAFRRSLLQALSARAREIAIQREQPVRGKSRGCVDEVFDAVIRMLQIHLPSDPLEEARAQLERLIHAADAAQVSFDAVVKNAAERAEAKLQIQLMGADCAAEAQQLLHSIGQRVSVDGVFQRLAHDALWLSVIIKELSQTGQSSAYDEIRLSYSVPPIGIERFTVLQGVASEIVSARQALDHERPWSSEPGNAGQVRSLHRDLLRQQIIESYGSTTAEADKIRLISSLAGDSHTEAFLFLFRIAFNSAESMHLREVALCLIEGIGPKIDMYEANEAARKTLARVTQCAVTRHFSCAELAIFLRILMSVGNLEGSSVLAQFLEDQTLRSRFKCDPLEFSILMLVLQLLSRGGTNTRCLEKLVLGIGIEHIDSCYRELIRRAASVALGQQKGGLHAVIQLIEFYRKAEQNDFVADALCDAIMSDDSPQKASSLSEIIEEGREIKFSENLSHYLRVVKSARGTRNPTLCRALLSILEDATTPRAIREEAASAIVNARGDIVLRVAQLVKDANPGDRLMLLRGLEGSLDEIKMQIVLALLSEPIGFSCDQVVLKQALQALSMCRGWQVI